MKKAAICLLALCISLTFSPLALAQGGVDSGDHTSTKSHKAYLKHQKHALKSQKRAEKKALKNWKKQHDVSH